MVIGYYLDKPILITEIKSAMNKDIWIVAKYNGKNFLRPTNHMHCESAWYDKYEAEAERVMFEVPKNYAVGSVHNVHEVRRKLDEDATAMGVAKTMERLQTFGFEHIGLRGIEITVKAYTLEQANDRLKDIVKDPHLFISTKVPQSKIPG
jgi:hypothetical protein